MSGGNRFRTVDVILEEGSDAEYDDFEAQEARLLSEERRLNQRCAKYLIYQST